MERWSGGELEDDGVGWCLARSEAAIGLKCAMWYSHGGIHFGKGLVSLVNEPKDNGFAELLFAIFIHVKNLLEGAHVYVVTKVDLLALGRSVSSLYVRVMVRPEICCQEG